MDLRVVQLGLIEYEKALFIQERLQKQRIEGKCLDTLLLLEHPPVLTMGTRAESNNIVVPKGLLEKMGVQIIECNRGGDVTYHGPGQIVGYPIIDLKGHGRDIRSFVHRLEQVFINILSEDFGIDSHRGEGKYTGVFVGTDKLTAIGISVSRWVTMHGFAFNVNTDLSHFQWIVPCGLQDKGVTSIQKLTGQSYDMNQMNRRIIKQFETLFDVNIMEVTVEELLASLEGDDL
ncbi:MAG: lipoyl(octanoyl) transferase LipB [Vallitaleaceae bacterium]|nr:lipoyl(octanoyl) transferase LipB [Vallitaleaceae bacterium]